MVCRSRWVSVGPYGPRRTVSKKEKMEDSSGTGQKKTVGAPPLQPSAQEATPALSGTALENNNWAGCSHSASSWHRVVQAPAFGALSNTRVRGTGHYGWLLGSVILRDMGSPQG